METGEFHGIIWNRGTSNCKGFKVGMNLDIQVAEWFV